MATWLYEIRYAARILWRNRTVTLVAFVTLTLAIGATTGIFTVVDTTLLRALPYPDADRLMQVARGYPRVVTTTSPPKFLAWHAQSREWFTQLAAYDSLGSGFNLVAAGRPDRLIGSRVSADFFGAMGVRPALGRDFRPDEDLPGQAKVVVLSHDVWMRRFDGRADLIGRSIALNGEPYTVIGIMPEGFGYPEHATLWTLFQFDPATTDKANFFEVVGRLRPGVSIAQARAGMALAGDAFRRAHPELMGERESIVINPLRERLYGNMRTALLVLLAAVGFVLLIACVNVANLQLAQASERHHEIAVRAALGASTWSVVRQLLIESLMLALISGIAGLCLAFWLVPALLAISPSGLADTTVMRVDRRVLAFTFGLSLLSGILFGLLPAWQAARPDLDRVLRASGRRTIGAGGRGSWLRRVLIAGEVALALMLTIGSFLLVTSLTKLRSVNPGFTVENVLTMKLSLPDARYGTPEALAQFQERVEDRISHQPGVRAAALTINVPMQPGLDMPFTIEGKYVPGTQQGVGDTFYRAIGPGYFSALQIPLRRGRLFDARDRRGTLPVAIINESAARQLWPGENPIGKRITVGGPIIPSLADPSPREIVGVVGNVREISLPTGTPPLLYVPLAQQNAALTRLAIRLLPFALVVRGDGPVASLAEATQHAVWSVDPAQPVSDVQLLREIVSRSLGSETFNTILLGSLAGLALLLAAVGLYGVIAHLVGQQTREIGVRMALGATQAGVLGLFLRQALLLVAIGIVIGLAGAFGLTRFLRSLLFEISTTDPWVFVLAPALLLLIAIAATIKPAMRAARIDPSAALRAE